jgi:ABC-type cobalamin/Fe3+-siderophores transport system ATPase subunit
VTTTILKDEHGAVIASAEQPLSRPNSPVVDFTPFTSAMQELGRAMYVGPFRNAINVGGQGSYYDIQIGEEFIRAFAGYKSGPSPDHNEAIYNLTQEIKRIFGLQSLDINAAGDYKSLQLMVDGRSYRLSEQGAGLSHFIVVLVNVLIRRPSLLLIDEPELNLHASLQLDFLQTLARYTDYGVIFATHSLGLARTAADTIYTLTKPVGGASTLRTYGADRELVTLLGQLSFDRRPDLGFSKVLLVEGKSELRALAQFLRFYHKEHEVLMLPLHGDELISGGVQNELSELLRIGGDIQYLIDSERKAAGDPLGKNRQAFIDLCRGLGISGHVLKLRALENYFTDAAVKQAFGDWASALGPYDKKGSGQNWPKTNNWRVAVEMSEADLKGTDLGTFLEQL